MPRPETLEPTSCQRDNQEGIDVPHKESNLKDVVLSGVNFRRLLREISVEYEQLRAQSLRFAGGQTDDPQDLCKFDGTVTGPELESKERDLEARQHGHHPVVNPQDIRRSVRRDSGPRASRFKLSDDGTALTEDLFDALDADGNEHVEMQELIEGLVKMRGKARKADVVASRLMLNTLMSKVSRFEHHMAEELQITSDQVNTLCVAMSTAFPEMFSQMDRN
eukprot:TRINITY_DN28791_c0_g1_i2.p1 TRINITY_DN28791_c0_g1~~TRINITY_DN28791_c0_g1_i2.p1  ORF type:complete len:221 (+),score=33.50 TRINITY_DN28791_c0_g1_i2:95-757(+)